METIEGNKLIVTKPLHLNTHENVTSHTTEYEYKGRKLILRMREGNGAKIHIFFPNSDKVQKTLRYIFGKPETLINKAKETIDRFDKEGITRKFK